MAVTAEDDPTVIEAVKRSADENVTRAILVGDAHCIHELAEAAWLALDTDDFCTNRFLKRPLSALPNSSTPEKPMF